MFRSIARLWLVVLVLLSSGAMPVPARMSKARACCTATSSCSMMSERAGGAGCCVLPERASEAHHEAADPAPVGACVLSAMGCGPAAATPPSAPIVFQFLLPLVPSPASFDGRSLVSPISEDLPSGAEPGIRPRPPRSRVAPEPLA